MMRSSLKKARLLVASVKARSVPAPLRDGRPVAYLHIPKVGGVAVAAGLRDALRPHRYFGGFDRVLFGDFRDFETIHPDTRRTVHLDTAGIDRDADLVAAHMALSTLRTAYPGHRLLTVMREPRARVVSLWLYWRAQPDAVLAPWGAWGERVRKSHRPLAEFLTTREVACQTDNLAVRMLLWPHPTIPEDGFIPLIADEALLHTARRALATLSFVGVNEDPELDQRIGNFLRSSFERRRMNETPALPPERRPVLAREFTAAAAEALQARTRLDSVLWRETARRAMPGGGDPVAVGEHAFLKSLFRYVEASVALAVV
jgi:hypothetical protein